jgi:hypothetical protein
LTGPACVTNFYQGSSEALSTTTLTAFQTKLTLDVTASSTGLYRIGWYYEWNETSASLSFKAQIQVDNTTTIGEHWQEPKDGATTQKNVASGFGYVTLTAGSHFIDVDYCSSATTATARIEKVRLECWKMT